MGEENGKVYVRFGSLPTQEMPIEWAERMLILWRKKHVAQFSKMLAEVVSEDQ